MPGDAPQENTESSEEQRRAKYKSLYYGRVSADDPHLQELRQRHAQLQKRLSQLREEELWNERQKKSLMNMVEVSLDAEGVLGKAAKRRSEVGEEEGEGEAEEKQRSVDAENVATEVNGAGQEDQQQESEATSTGKRQTNEDSSDAVTEDMLPSLTEEEKEALERLKHSADSNSLTEQLSEIEERIADIQREKGRLQRQIQLVEVELRTKENRLRHTPEELIQQELAKARAQAHSKN